MALADDVLTLLFQRGERAALSKSGRATNVWLSKDVPAYWELSLDARDSCHERLRAAAKADAVELKWSQQGGDDRTVDLIRLRDLQALADFVGVHTTVAQVERARQCLVSWVGVVARVDEILERWAAMKKVRGLSPAAAPDLADALRVLDALQAGTGEDQIVRRLSVELFRDSKRIERIDRHLDLLTSESIQAPARSWEEVFGGLGLVKEPQPFLVAGQGQLQLAAGEACPVVQPFVGVANKVLTSYAGRPAWILTVENLTTFHLCSQLPNATEGVILFTGGMPSPSWCRAYRAVLAGVPAKVPAFHWGDIDAGGFRIAARLRECVEQDRPFLPWLMLATELPSEIQPEPADATTTLSMRRHAVRAGWLELAAVLPDACIEQEVIPPRLPSIR